jgi:hypothetical protein
MAFRAFFGGRESIEGPVRIKRVTVLTRQGLSLDVHLVAETDRLLLLAEERFREEPPPHEQRGYDAYNKRRGASATRFAMVMACGLTRAFFLHIPSASLKS